MKKVIGILVLFLGGQLSAHNNYFLPGDAFFSISLSGEEVKGWKEDQPQNIKLGYERLDNHFMACGNIGYAALEITGVDQSFRENLLEAYEWVRSYEEPLFVKNEAKGKEELVEWNPVVALIYNKGKVALPLGVKFNENWKVEGMGVYGGFFDDAWSVVQDWKRGEMVDPLKLEKRLAPVAHLKNEGDVHRAVDETLALKASDAEVVFVGILKKNSWVHNECLNLKKLAGHENWLEATTGAAFYLRVTSDGVRLFEYDEEGKLKESIQNAGGQWVEVKKE